MDYSNIVKVMETTNRDTVNAYLDTKRWIILAAGPGQDEDKSAYILYSLGWYGPADPAAPEDDTSEFPPKCKRVVE